MGRQTLFSHALRILTCANCGAPIDTSAEGGQFKCTFCQTLNHLGPRVSSKSPSSSQALSESERVAGLRQQDRHPAPPPPVVAKLLVGDRLPPANVAAAEQMWVDARRELGASRSFHVEERLFHLSVALAPCLEDRAQRAKLETAIELLADEGHRQVMQCMLARLAAQHGDVEAAALWLEPVDARPLALLMDTAYRLAAATLATARGDFREVTQLLGTDEGDVPFADGDEFACQLLRIHALENLQREELATKEIAQLIDTRGVDLVHNELKRYLPLRICARSFPAGRDLAQASASAVHAALQAKGEARQRAANDIQRQAVQTQLQKAEENWFRPVSAIGALVVTFVISFLISAPWTLITVGAMDADPLFGAHARMFCPRVCDDCVAPYRMATWNRNGNQEGAVFCSDTSGRVASMDESSLWMAAVSDDAAIHEQEVPGGGFALWLSMVVVALPIGAFLTGLLMLAGYKKRLQVRRALRSKLESLA